MKRIPLELAFNVSENRQEFVEYSDYSSEAPMNTEQYWMDNYHHNREVLRKECGLPLAQYNQVCGSVMRSLAKVVAICGAEYGQNGTLA